MPEKGNISRRIAAAAIFIILEMAAVAMLKYDGVLQNTWISKGFHGIRAGVWGGMGTVGDYFRLKKINEELVRENFELAKLVRQHESLSAGYGLHEIPDSMRSDHYGYISAAVSTKGRGGQHNYLIIDKGSEDGVRLHSGIITPHGAVGIVDAVSRHYSYARSFASAGMAVSARIGRDGSAGALKWDGTDTRSATLSEIPQHIPVTQGDTVYTSGFSAIFPPDIPLGTIERWKIVNGATYDIKIKLFEDYSRLKYVTVVHNLDEEELKELIDR